MPLVPVGRSLTAKGTPVPDTGIMLDTDSLSFRLLESQRDLLLITNPITGEIGTTVELEDRNGKVEKRGFGIMKPGSMGPPLHFHPHYTEYFEVVEGQAMFTLDGKKHLLNTGDKIVVSPETPHSFQPYGDAYLAILVDAKPTGRLQEVVTTLFGLAHEGRTDKRGRPSFWQGMVMGMELGDDTVFVDRLGIQKLLVNLMGPVAKMLGYDAIYDRLLEEKYWKKWVEQMDLVSKN